MLVMASCCCVALGGFMAVNFWRPVLPMKGPVKKAPLAVCDPSSVKLEE